MLGSICWTMRATFRIIDDTIHVVVDLSPPVQARLLKPMTDLSRE